MNTIKLIELIHLYRYINMGTFKLHFNHSSLLKGDTLRNGCPSL